MQVAAEMMQIPARESTPFHHILQALNAGITRTVFVFGPYLDQPAVFIQTKQKRRGVCFFIRKPGSPRLTPPHPHKVEHAA
jgi:hypothetical protein